MCPNVDKCIFVVCPFLVAFFPCCDMLTDQIGTELLRFDDVDMARKTRCTRWIIYGYETLPLATLLAKIPADGA